MFENKLIFILFFTFCPVILGKKICNSKEKEIQVATCICTSTSTSSASSSSQSDSKSSNITIKLSENSTISNFSNSGENLSLGNNTGIGIETNCTEECASLSSPGKNYTESDPDNNDCLSKIGDGCSNDNDCIENSFCKSEWNSKGGRFTGKCRCNPKFYNNGENVCERRSKFGESCTINSKPCELGPLLNCNKNGICGCKNESTQIYDPIRRTCVYRTGEGCYEHRARSDYSVCTSNARCNYFYNSIKSIQPICKCLDGFTQTLEGFCHAGHGSQCNASVPCDHSSGLVCTDGRCLCDAPLRTVYDEKLRKCAKLIGTACDISKDFECVSYASCQLAKEIKVVSSNSSSSSNKTGNDSLTEITESKHVCKCNKGYSGNFVRVCKLDFGEKCSNDTLRPILKSSSRISSTSSGSGSGSSSSSSSSSSNGDSHWKYFTKSPCNSDAGLACKKGRCECFDSTLIYDKDKKSCFSNEKGGFCGINKRMGVKYLVSCSTKNFVCSKKTDGQCECVSKKDFQDSKGALEKCLSEL